MKHLCVGCGLCAAICPNNQITMLYSPDIGCYLPSLGYEECTNKCGLCELSCPFAEENVPTNIINEMLYGKINGANYDQFIGNYLQCYVGYSSKYRDQSSSGGLVTWLLVKLLDDHLVDAVLCVGKNELSPTSFSYKLCRSQSEIESCSGSCYQPVELSDVIREALKGDGKIAIVAVPCVARGLRLAMNNNKKIQNKVKFILGLTCGQNKSRKFVEYLSFKYSKRKKPVAINFRKKIMSRPANDFSFEFFWKNGNKLELQWSKHINREWMDRWFTLEACDYCDDIFAECSDAVFMDAWRPEYSQEPKGTSIVVIRNEHLRKLFIKYHKMSEINIDIIRHEEVVLSQKNTVHQKRVLSKINAIKNGKIIKIPELRETNCDVGYLQHLEAWTKRKVRSVTQRFNPEKKVKLYIEVGLVCMPWKVLIMIKRVVNRVHRLLGRHVL